jgi:hypothetical protein
MHKARLRLAAAPATPSSSPGVTRTYTRVENGRPQRVNQYQNHRPPHARLPAPKGAGAKGDYKGMPTTKMDWKDLKEGDVVDFGGEPWEVLHTYVGGPSSVKPKAGKANTKGTTSGKNTGSKGKGVNTTGGTSSGKAAKGKVSTTPVTDVLENKWTGKRVQITLHPSFKVLVY